MATDERVLCFERKLFDELGSFQGLSMDVEKYLSVLTLRRHLVYHLRSKLEHDRRYKQLIPYVILVETGCVLRYKRGRKGGEDRLHGLYSIGIGGHISDEDVTLFSEDGAGYYDGMWREVAEEVTILPSAREAAVALINDDSTDVGAVHFGVVHIVQVEPGSVRGGRKGYISTPEVVPVGTAVDDFANYEPWSQLCLQHFPALLAKADSGDHSLKGIITSHP